eukprot:CAMPEP_0114241132 /NCGR_PEP_ID=MMETSP0058-20121206/9474_1 /TAXON_ID=36894 /ORGANISM="Pyramimonas parkeae, CCMP726" /LENGTH=337 /DNA_ID=CAMNT_0001353647 /DNA_START=495 /DNA_END=1509 /DNA_ORIENTATION=-
MQSGRKTTRRQTKQSPKLTPYSDNSASTDRPALFQDGVNRIQSPASSSGRGQRRQSIHPIHKAEAPINQSTLSSKYANTRPHINGVAVQSAECMQSSSAALPVEGSLHSKVFAAETPLEHASLTSFCDKLTTSNHPSGSSKRRISVSEGVADHLRHAPSTAAGRLAHANSQGGRDLGTSNPLQSFINGMADWLVPGMNPGDAFMAHMYNSGLMSPQQKAMLGMSQDASFPIGFNSQIFGSLNKPMSQFRGVTRPLFTASWDAMCVYSPLVRECFLEAASEYEDRGIQDVKEASPYDFIQAMVQQSKTAHCRSSKFRGVWQSILDTSKWEAKYVDEDS